MTALEFRYLKSPLIIKRWQIRYRLYNRVRPDTLGSSSYHPADINPWYSHEYGM